MGQIALFIDGIKNFLFPKTTKKAFYYILNLFFLGLAIAGYYFPWLRVIGIIYTVILGILLFAGINSLED